MDYCHDAVEVQNRASLIALELADWMNKVENLKAEHDGSAILSELFDCLNRSKALKHGPRSDLICAASTFVKRSLPE